MGGGPLDVRADACVGKTRDCHGIVDPPVGRRTWSVVEVETGETFADAWNRADQEHRRLMFINMKARLYISPTVTGWHLPKDLETRIRQSEGT
jgi:hypothetical protein